MILEEKLHETHKKAHNAAFSWYVRKGFVPPLLTELMEATASVEAFMKFNPNHDELGRFTFGPGGSVNLEGEPRIPRQYSVTVNSETQIVIHHPDGTDEIRDGGTKNWRNNNPGNLSYITSDFAKRHGAVGEDANHFAIFPDMQTGEDAAVALLKGPTYSSVTINRAIEMRSPPNENDTLRLQREIAKENGLSGMRIIGSLSDDELTRLVNAIYKWEGSKGGTVVFRKPQ